MDFAFDNSFCDAMEGVYAPAEAAKPSAPKLFIFNHALAEALGIKSLCADDSDLLRIFSGEEIPESLIQNFGRNSEVFTLWLPITPALGEASRPTASRPISSRA